MSLLTLISQIERNISEWLARCVWLGEVQAGWGCSVGLPSSRERARWELGKPNFCPPFCPYEFLTVFVFVSALMHFSLYQPFCISLCICVCISPCAFLSVFVFVFAPLVCQAQERRLGENTENPTPFLLFLCISLVSVFVFALLVCAAQGQSNQRILSASLLFPPFYLFFEWEKKYELQEVPCQFFAPSQSKTF